jgi:SAM-dependent methyltransferase
MAHQEQINFCKSVKEFMPDFFKGVSVLDIGSLDINGNNRYLFENYDYTGIDIGEGKNVDIVCKGHEFKPAEKHKFDVVISTECFEHDKHWRETVRNVIDNLLKSGGLFLFTCATTGRPEHGTKRTSPSDSPFTSKAEDWEDYYMNLTEGNFFGNFNFEKDFLIYQFKTRLEYPQDLYFWGIKR